MKGSELRPLLVEWLTGQLGIETWYLQPPDFTGQIAGFVPPLKDIDIMPVDDQYSLKATQEFMVGFRYEDIAYKDLPIAELEGLYITTLMAAYGFYAGLGIDINPFKDETPLVVQEYNENGYLVYLCWTLEIDVLNIEPEEDLRDNAAIQSITMSLYRRSLIGDLDTKVMNITKTQEAQ